MSVVLLVPTTLLPREGCMNPPHLHITVVLSNGNPRESKAGDNQNNARNKKIQIYVKYRQLYKYSDRQLKLLQYTVGHVGHRVKFH